MKHSAADRLASVRQSFQRHVWPELLRLAWPLFRRHRRLRRHRLSVSRIEGVVADGGHSLTVLCSATKQNREYLLRQLFAKVTRETAPATVRLPAAFRPGFRRRNNSGLVILETNRDLHQSLDAGGWFFIPAWVTGQVQLPSSAQTRRSGTTRNIHRKIRKHGFTCEVSRAEAQFKDFYDHMYVPYVTKTFGPAAYCQTCAEIWKKCSEGGFDLVLIRKPDRPEVFVAGCLIIYEAAGPRLCAFGVRDADMNLMREGVQSALYLFCFDHLWQTGFAQVNLGGSRPFLRDGVLALKKRLSQTLIQGRWDGFALKVLALTPATRFFLVNHPFILQANGRLLGAVFTEAPLTVATVTALDAEFFYPGLSKLLLYFFGDIAQFQSSSLPPELAARVEIRAAAAVVSGDLHLP